MAKKVNQTFTATLTKNTEKGGAWLADFTVVTEGIPEVRFKQSAWSNASAGKRWIKERVVENTTRKSIKMVVATTSPDDKPISFKGELVYKVEA
jgi:hypothetical protein